jgi:argininosuccinate synthase
MDELGGFEPTDTTGFIQIESIRIKKYVVRCSIVDSIFTAIGPRWAQSNILKGRSGVEPKDVYGASV